MLVSAWLKWSNRVATFQLEFSRVCNDYTLSLFFKSPPHTHLPYSDKKKLASSKKVPLNKAIFYLPNSNLHFIPDTRISVWCLFFLTELSVFRSWHFFRSTRKLIFNRKWYFTTPFDCKYVVVVGSLVRHLPGLKVVLYVFLVGSRHQITES